MSVTTDLANYDKPPSLANPRSGRKHKGGNFEKWAWMFMRFSGMALVLLALGHVFIMLAWDSHGVHRINSAFVAQRWNQPFWQLWDITMLWLAEIHGANGIRTIISDYTRKDKTKFWLNAALLLSVIVVIGVGTYALLTFDISKF